MHLPELSVVDGNDAGLRLNLTQHSANAIVTTVTTIGHEKHEALSHGETHAQGEHGKGDDGAN